MCTEGKANAMSETEKRLLASRQRLLDKLFAKRLTIWGRLCLMFVRWRLDQYELARWQG